MIRGMRELGSVVAVAMMTAACGGGAGPSGPVSSAPPPNPGTTSTSKTASSAPGTGATGDATPQSASASGAIASAAPPAGAPATPPPAAPPAHPFAHNAEEATSLIDDAITTKAGPLMACVDAARVRRKDAHARLVVTVGIDEDGHMIGIELPKGEKKDKALVDCMLDALHGAPFPKSHAGVITVRRTFEDKAVYR